MRIKLHDTDVELSYNECSIYELNFYTENPRVYTYTHSVPGFSDLSQEEQQEAIFEKLKKQESFKNLLPTVKEHGGLMEPVLVRWDTQEVVEGNSRLAVYRALAQTDRSGAWDSIPCHIASGLTQEQMVAFLSQVHVKGKTKWSAYEKANFAYVHRKKGWSTEKIAQEFGESPGTISHRIRVIERMKRNRDEEFQHFSYYDVIERRPEIKRAVDEDSNLEDFLLTRIRGMERSKVNSTEFTAQEMREKLPRIIEKPKVLKAFAKGDADLHEAYERARISRIEETIRKATGLLEDVGLAHVKGLEKPRYNAFKQDLRKLTTTVKRINKMVEENQPS